MHTYSKIERDEMLERDKGPAIPHAFLIAIPLQSHVEVADIIHKLVDAVSWYEGTGNAEVEHLGPLTTYDEPGKCEICGTETSGEQMKRCPEHYQKAGDWI